MAYSFQTFTLNQVLTAAQMNQVEVNIRDHVHTSGGVSGYAAGSVDQSAIGGSAVGQGELKTTTASGSTSAPTTGATHSLTGGSYSWWTAAGRTVANGNSLVSFGGSNTAAGVIGIAGDAAGAIFEVDENYIQASPPYSFGPLFVYLLINLDGTIECISVAPDPTWAYHGPTNIIPQRREANGKAFRTVETFDGKPWMNVKDDPALLRAVLAGDVVPVKDEIEITLAYKDSDIDVRPHPWCYNAPDSELMSGRTVVLLEPGTSMMDKFYDILKNSHANEVKTIIQGGYLSVSNEVLDVPKKPRGVQVARCALKNTKADGGIVRP